MSGEFPFDHFLKKGQLEKPFSSPQTPSPQVQKSNENNDIGELRELETEILGLLKDSIPKQKLMPILKIPLKLSPLREIKLFFPALRNLYNTLYPVST